MKYYVSARTDVGRKRINNEDNLSVNERYMPAPAQRSYSLFVELAEGVLSVCDGMGGESYGENASLTGAKTIADNYSALLCNDVDQRKEVADRLVQSANASICAEMQERKVRIGSTAVFVCFKGERADIFNVGDSRAYVFRNGTLKQFSKDHTVLQQKIDNGAITVGESGGSEKHQLTQHLGIFESEMLIEAYHDSLQLQPNDAIILCSDGLTDMVSNEEIAAICRTSQDADAISSTLIGKALENGGKDNVTVVVAVVKNEASRPITATVPSNQIPIKKNAPPDRDVALVRNVQPSNSSVSTSESVPGRNAPLNKNVSTGNMHYQENPKTKTNPLLIIFTAVTAVALIAALIIFVPKLLRNGEDTDPSTSGNPSGSTSSNDITSPSDSTNNPDPNSNESKIKWPDEIFYEYNIPEITMGKIDDYLNGDVFIYDMTREGCLEYLRNLVAAGIKDDVTVANIERFEKKIISTVNIELDDGMVLNIEYRNSEADNLGVIISLAKVS